MFRPTQTNDEQLGLLTATSGTTTKARSSGRANRVNFDAGGGGGDSGHGRNVAVDEPPPFFRDLEMAPIAPARLITPSGSGLFDAGPDSSRSSAATTTNLGRTARASSARAPRYSRRDLLGPGTRASASAAPADADVAAVGAALMHSLKGLHLQHAPSLGQSSNATGTPPGGRGGRGGGDDDTEAGDGASRASASRGGGKKIMVGWSAREWVSWSAWYPYLHHSIKDLLFGSRLNILLLCVPASLACWGRASDGWTFLFALLALAPLAERLGAVTEQTAVYTNDQIGGLLNATFGNATELIVSLLALKHGLYRVVQLSLLGSVLSNLLLVLGTAFFLGGTRYKVQAFNAKAAMVNGGLLMLASLALMLPAALAATHTELRKNASQLLLSRLTALAMFLIYGAFIFFQLKTHADLFEEDRPDGDEGDDADEDEDEPYLGLWGCLVWLSLITIVIAMVSDALVDAIEGAASAWGAPLTFLSVILLPIVGNAAEHASAIIFSMRNKLDISIGVAVGSSTQISLMVFPLAVLVGWAINAPLDLNLEVFELCAYFGTVVTVVIVISDGNSTWLKGLTLIVCYLVLSAAFWLHSDPLLALEEAQTALGPPPPSKM